MSKKTREQTDPRAGAAQGLRPLVPVLLLVIGAVASLLALFQWMELLVVRAGGTAVCGLSSVLDCQKVWDAPFASSVHGLLGMPLAALGLVWGLAAFGAGAAWTHQLLAGRDGGSQAAAVKLVAWAGLAVIPVFAFVAFNAGALCLTCLATYVVVGAFALVALRLVPGGLWPKEAMGGGAVWATGLALGAYLVLLGPGIATPRPGGADSKSALGRLPTAQALPPGTVPTGAVKPAHPVEKGPSRPLTPADQAVASFLQNLSPPERQSVSNALSVYVNGQVPSGADGFSPRWAFGSPASPVKVVEWVDFRCGACRMLNDTLRELKRVVPDGSVAIESRNFPLDSQCNPHVNRDGGGISCLAAKASICLEDSRDYWKLRDRLFESQQTLTQEQILSIASSGELSRPKLDACLSSPKTDQKLREDIDYAMRYNPHGTPLLVVNGRESTPGGAGPFLYALALTNGDSTSPAFGQLPPPRMVQAHDGHQH